MTLLRIEESRTSTARPVVLLITTVISALGEQKDINHKQRLRTIWEVLMLSAPEGMSRV